MRLKRIEIENFKGVGARQAIDLKPITLLFGPNSAGKSTILQALHYVREILERGNLDADKILAGGLIDLGGFQSMIHNHDLSLTMSFKLVFDLSADQSTEQLPLNVSVAFADEEFAFLPLNYLIGEASNSEAHLTRSVAIEVKIQWNNKDSAPFVSCINIEFNEAPIATIESPAAEGRAMITNFNYCHELLQNCNTEDDLDNDDKDEILEKFVDELPSSFEFEIFELSREMQIARQSGNQPASPDRISVKTVFGALPDVDKELWCDTTDVDDRLIELRYSKGASVPRLNAEDRTAADRDILNEYKRRVGLNKLLDELLVGPLRIARDYLNEMIYIGPLREIPSRAFRARKSPDESRWAHGLAAWDLLYNDRSGGLFAEVNGWMDGELKTGYVLVDTDIREIPASSRIDVIFERGVTEDDLGELQELYENLEYRTEITLFDTMGGVNVTPSDVGVGVSQLLPIVVGCLVERSGLLAIEQPELHIHPAVQVGIGDLLIRAIKPYEEKYGDEKSLLVETHSEHILLRLLRRIRETTAAELPYAAPELRPEELSVFYVDRNGSGVQFEPLRVDAEGEFLDRWPHGFFEERAEELF